MKQLESRGQGIGDREQGIGYRKQGTGHSGTGDRGGTGVRDEPDDYNALYGRACLGTLYGRASVPALGWDD